MKLNYSSSRLVLTCTLLCTLFLGTFSTLKAQTLKETALQKISDLEVLISLAEGQGLDVIKEKMTVRTAEVFLYYADWDEVNIEANKTAFAMVSRYKTNAQEMAELLADFERQDVIDMLDAAIAYTNKLIAGDVVRKAIPQLDWAQISHDGDQLTFNGRPCFPLDYTWKPNTAGPYDLTEFYGNQDGYYMNPNYIQDKNGTFNSYKLNELKGKETGTLGFMFLGNNNTANWAEAEYGPDYRMREGTYTEYDIDNPGARKILGQLLSQVATEAAGKKYSELGYMLCNEPHFYTTKKANGDLDWASGPVSEYTKDNFRTWLSTKHASIADLNTLWGTSFASFDDVTIEIPISITLTGTPKWYDWVTFNRLRVTQWYSDLKDTIQTYDPEGKVHLKIMPNLWSENKRGHGIDFEALTDLSEIIGNDSGSENAPMWGQHEWKDHYAFDWRELFMAFDFAKSVGPNKISYNTETHYLSTGKSRDLYQDPLYARATFWASTTHGLNANQVWYWMREPDGSYDTRRLSNGYAGSNNQQPRIINEVASTLMDLNAFAEEITAMQRQRKPIRIFHSETSAINISNHMDNLFELYEDLVFDGVPIGFVTEGIITKQSNSLWDVVLVHNTPRVTDAEFNALQTYLNNGGTVIIDGVSLKKDEYNRSRAASLTAGSGALIASSSLEEMKMKAFAEIENKGLMPEVTVTENNTNAAGFKGCTWKCIKNSAGNNVLSIINLGKTDAELTISLKEASVGTACTDLLNGVAVTSKPTLKPNEVFFVEVKDEKNVGILNSNANQVDIANLHPNPSYGQFNIDFYSMQTDVKLTVFNMQGQSILNEFYSNVDSIKQSIERYPSGNYLVRVSVGNDFQSFKILKQ